MSTETSNWLNQNVLVGMTAKRGNAWHYKASEQGAEPNHYEGAIPVEDVRRRLFHWTALEMPMFVEFGDEKIQIPNKKAICRSDNFAPLGVTSNRYAPHQYDEWLINNVSNILDDNLVIGSAGLLRGGAIAWVQVEMPESMKVADVEFRPNLLATTSFDLSIPTTFKRTVTVVVCDNTRTMALNEKGQEVRIRHTANSALRLGEAREALSIVHQMSDDFAREVEMLLSMKVDDRQFDRFLDKLLPTTIDTSKHGLTRADNTKQEFWGMWNNDTRVAPWKGTGYGVVQAVNTYRQHIRPVRGSTIGVERTMLETLSGVTQKEDTKALELLAGVLG